MKNLLVIIMLICSSNVQATKTGNLSGFISDEVTGKALPGARVLIEDTKYGTNSNSVGFFLIKDIPVGIYTIQASCIGYAKKSITDFEVIEDSTISIDIKMSLQRIEMSDMAIEAERPDIEKIEISTPFRATPSKDKKSYERESPPEGYGSTALEDSPEVRESRAPEDSPKAKESKARTSLLDKKERKAREGYASPGKSGLKAGFADDNKQYNFFINFLEKYGTQANHYPIDVSERIHLKVQDEYGKALPNAEISVYSDNEIISKGKTYADGSFLFFPSLYDKDIQSYTVKYIYNQISGEKVIGRFSERTLDLPVKLDRDKFGEVALDILFILDTTGSMGEEINKLKTTLEIIHYNLVSLDPKIKVRFGLVLYRDKGDDYRTRVVQLTDDVEGFQDELSKVTSNGGGDGPEDLQSALKTAIKEINWNPNGIRLGFIITDAPPHLDYGQEYTYTEASKEAKELGIKLFSVGTGGLNLAGEYVLRQISQLTYAKYLFLTYGEKGESEGGKPGSVSHHTGANYQTDKLEAIIIQLSKEELSYLIDIHHSVDEEYFIADKIDDEENEVTLKILFTKALSQLEDYSSIKIETATTLAVLPITSNNESLDLESKYFTEQLILSAINNTTFSIVERTELKNIMEEWKLQLTGVISDTLTGKIGELMGAQVLLLSSLFNKKDNYEMFLKLIRVETGELLAATKLKIDHQLAM